MKAERLYRAVADDLLAMINSDQYSVGDRLPAERDLANQFNVSRPTMREAVIALEIYGHVEVRKGSGVYIVSKERNAKDSVDLDVGAFELTEARMMVEGEAAGLAATMITEEELELLSDTVDKIQQEIDDDVKGEVADREFHMLIAQATRNSAIVSIIEELWNAREKSELTSNIYKTVRSGGVQPNIAEHKAILDALKSRNPREARRAMRTHLSRVIDTLLHATEVEAVEEAKRKVSADRDRFTRIWETGL